MAYKLKYYKVIESQGHAWRLVILQDTDADIVAQEIGGVLRSLRLVSQGDQADIDTPIIKTSLEMVFVDALDIEDGRKNGAWEEFYTSNATEYRVALQKDGETQWIGYVTPDSFSEDLRYRGSVSIIARDNLGALQDYMYDISGDEMGMVTLRELVKTALERVSFGMDLKDSGLWPACAEAASPSLYDVQFNSAAFRDKNWWEVLESVLYATGTVLRYVGAKMYKLSPIRGQGLGIYDSWAAVPKRNVRFCAYGHRELSPAAKSIKEDVSFEIEENIADFPMPSSNFGAAGSYNYMPSPTVSTDTVLGPIHAVVGGWDSRTTANSMLLNVFAYGDSMAHRFGKAGSVKDLYNVYLACNTYDSRTASFRQYVLPGTYQIRYDLFGLIGLYDNKTNVGYIETEALPTLDDYKVLVQFIGDDGSVWSFKHVSGGYTYEWVQQNITEGMTLSGSLPYTETLPEIEIPTAGYIIVTFSDVSAWVQKPSARASEGYYLGVNNIQISVIDNKAPIMEKLKITTEYDSRNNIILIHSPQFASNPSDIVSPRLVRNGMYVIDADGWPVGSEKWSWNRGDAQQPLAVLIHQQLLAYYSKPNNVLTGELLDASGETPDFSSLWKWNGKNHLLISGTLNILTGRMENAVLREFTRYDDMWEA